jgi:hypothetical protein
VLLIFLGNLDSILECENRRFELWFWWESVVFGFAHVLEFVDVVLRGDNLLAATRAEITSHDAEACQARSLLGGSAWHCAMQRMRVSGGIHAE